MSMRQCGSTGLGDRKKSNSLPQALPWWEGLHACTGMVHLAPGCLLHPSQGWPSCCWMAPSCILLQQIGFCFFPCSLPEDAELSRCCWGSQTSPAVATSSEGGEACPWTTPCACSPKACSVSAGSHYCGCLEERGQSLDFLLAAFVLAGIRGVSREWKSKKHLQRSCSSEHTHSSQWILPWRCYKGLRSEPTETWILIFGGCSASARCFGVAVFLLAIINESFNRLHRSSASLCSLFWHFPQYIQEAIEISDKSPLSRRV